MKMSEIGLIGFTLNNRTKEMRVQRERLRGILRDILKQEFIGLKGVDIFLVEVVGGLLMFLQPTAFVHFKNKKRIYFDSYYSILPDNEIKEILRHELLHIETGLGDKDPEFRRLLKERKIIDSLG